MSTIHEQTIDIPDDLMHLYNQEFGEYVLLLEATKMRKLLYAMHTATNTSKLQEAMFAVHQYIASIK